MQLSAKEITANDELKISVTVENTGSVVGEEVVQLYIRDLVGSISRPVKELKGFEKISLNPGEKKVVNFTLTSKDLEFFGAEGEWSIEPGEYKLWVGTNSAEGLEYGFVLN